jgi:hypothetical protein
VNSDYRQGNPYAQQDPFSSSGNPYQQSTGYGPIPSGNGGYNGGSYGEGYGQNEYEMNTYGGASQSGNSLTDFFAEVRFSIDLGLMRSVPK